MTLSARKHVLLPLPAPSAPNKFLPWLFPQCLGDALRESKHMFLKIQNFQKEVGSSVSTDIVFSSEVLHRKWSIQESMAGPWFSTDDLLI